jgi:hypothetical protein
MSLLMLSVGYIMMKPSWLMLMATQQEIVTNL